MSESTRNQQDDAREPRETIGARREDVEPRDDRRPQDRDPGGETIGATGDARGDEGLQKDPSEWVSGDDPMTPAQKSYLDTLAKQAGEELPADLTKAEASEHIDRLKQGGGQPR